MLLTREEAATTRQRSLIDLVRGLAADRPGDTATIYEGRTTTWSELDEHGSMVANWLQALGVAPTDRVAYLGRNSDRFFEVLVGVAKAGAVLVPLNWRLTPSELEPLLLDSGARVLFVDEDLSATIAVEVSPRRSHRIAIGSCAADTTDAYIAGRDRFAAVDPQLDANAEAVLQLYTSGTTGRPKGALITHEALLAAADMCMRLDVFRWRPDETVLVSMPLFHIGGFNNVILAWSNGSAALIQGDFSTGDILDAVDDHEVPLIGMVPAAVQLLLDDPKAAGTDFSRLRHVVYGAAPMPAPLLLRAMEIMGCEFVQGYGMTESGLITILLPEDHHPAGNPRTASVGRPYPGVEVRIVGSNGRDLPAGEIGEIWVRSPATMVGYAGNEEATHDVLVGGWLRTGDGGRVDADGYLYLTDRLSDTIISGGENIYPAEVEAAIRTHPTVRDACVVAAKDDRWGEVPKAFVTIEDGSVLDPGALREHLARKIAAFKVPRSFVQVEALPRNAGGKLIRRQVRELDAAESAVAT